MLKHIIEAIVIGLGLIAMMSVDSILNLIFQP